jgi:streptogramin lyase
MRRALLTALAAGLVLVTATAGGAGEQFPATIALPAGFAPEGIAIDQGGQFYAGSIPTGAIYRGSVRTGQGEVLVPGVTGRAALGIDVDNHRRVFVAGGPTGSAYVYDGESGGLIATYALVNGQTFVNDVVVTRGGAYFTDSFRPVVYRTARSARRPRRSRSAATSCTGPASTRTASTRRRTARRS